jgi:hypothetical protein
MGFIYDIRFEYARQCAENIFPTILTQAPVCKRPHVSAEQCSAVEEETT